MSFALKSLFFFFIFSRTIYQEKSPPGVSAKGRFESFEVLDIGQNSDYFNAYVAS